MILPVKLIAIVITMIIVCSLIGFDKSCCCCCCCCCCYLQKLSLGVQGLGVLRFGGFKVLDVGFVRRGFRRSGNRFRGDGVKSFTGQGDSACSKIPEFCKPSPTPLT